MNLKRKEGKRSRGVDKFMPCHGIFSTYHEGLA